MTTNPLELRIIRLERTLRALTAGCLALGALLLLAAFTQPQDETVRARRFELVDGEGLVRAELAIDAQGSAGLFVRDDQKRVRASVTHDSTQSALLLRDDSGTVRLGAAQFAHGGGGFALHGPGSKGAAVLYLKEQGSLTFYDEDGEVLRRVPE